RRSAELVLAAGSPASSAPVAALQVAPLREPLARDAARALRQRPLALLRHRPGSGHSLHLAPESPHPQAWPWLRFSPPSTLPLAMKQRAASLASSAALQ